MRLQVLAGAVLLAALIACGSPRGACNSATCATGCCDATGQCQPSPSPAACGQNGFQCVACTAGQICLFGTCTTPSSSGGAAGGSTGGTGGLGGTGGAGGAGGLGGGGGATCSGCWGGGGAFCVSQTQNTTSNCGFNGVLCVACTLNQVCASGLCQGAPGGGAGGGTGGGAGGGGLGGGVGGGLGGGTGSNQWEADTCSQATTSVIASSGTVTVYGDTSPLAADYVSGVIGTCSGNGSGGDAVYQVVHVGGGSFTATASATSSSTYLPVLYLRAVCTTATDLACFYDGACVATTGTITLSTLAAGTYYLVVDSCGTATGPYQLTITQ